MRIWTVIEPIWGWRIIWWIGRVASRLPISSLPSFRMTGLCNPIKFVFLSADNCSSTHCISEHSEITTSARQHANSHHCVSHDHNLIRPVETASFSWPTRPSDDRAVAGLPYVNCQRFLTSPWHTFSFLGLWWYNQTLFLSHPARENLFLREVMQPSVERECVFVFFPYTYGGPILRKSLRLSSQSVFGFFVFWNEKKDFRLLRPGLKLQTLPGTGNEAEAGSRSWKVHAVRLDLQPEEMSLLLCSAP